MLEGIQSALLRKGSIHGEQWGVMTIVFEKAPRNTVLVSTCVVRVKRQRVNLGVHGNNCASP